MKIAILTSGILPVPAVKGGAVENLIDFLLEYNEQHRLHDITVYSIADKATKHHPALAAKLNHYRYIDVNSLLARIEKRIFHYLMRYDGYYHYTIEYFLEKAMRHLSRHHYDMVILENRPAYALRMLGRTAAPMVYHLHNDKLTPDSDKCQEIYGAATGIIAVSDYIRQGVQAISPGDTKTVTVYNGIDLQAFAKQERAERSSLGLKESDFVLVFSGRVTPEKGIMQLIEAMKLLKDHKDIKLLVIGSSFYSGDDNNNPYGQMLRENAAPLEGRIIFTGFKPYAEMPRYLSMADVAVVPSIWDEPFGLTCLEAMAAGLPLITTRRGGIPEVATADSAILLDTDQQLAEHIADAILDLYRHPDKRRHMGQAAQQRSQLFSKEQYAKNFFDAIAKM